MARLRIGVLYEHYWSEDETPAPGRRPRRQPPEKDVVEVHKALKKLGHSPLMLRLDGTVESLHSLARRNVDLVFNLVESWAGDDTRDTHIAAYLELIGKPFTGSGPLGLALGADKVMAKKIFEFHKISTPNFATVWRGRMEHAHDIQFPVIVKPAREDGSIGIPFSAYVESIKELMSRIDELHAQFDTPVLVEEYVEGREIYVGVLGNTKPEALPPIELDLSKLPEGTPRIAGTEVKWERRTEAYKQTQPKVAGNLDEKTQDKLRETALTAFQALGLRDYARIDIRLDRNNVVHVLEVNPNPYLLSSAELAMAAKQTGRNYTELIGEIVRLAMERYGFGSMNGGGR
jgi:D-alanine-D-alanine ligase